MKQTTAGLRIVASAAVGAALLLGSPALAIDLNTGAGGTAPTLRGGGAAAPRIQVKLKSLYEQRWQHVVRQKSDIGCSAASLATILTYYFGFPTDEEEMIEALHSEALSAPAPDLDADILYRGFNMRHIRNVARKGGLIAAAFHVPAEQLEEVKIPVITRVTIRGFDHFVVFRQAKDHRVYIADPAFGNTVYTDTDFVKMWSGVMMGFLRRSGDPVVDHELVLTSSDRRVVEWDEISRTLARISSPAVAAPTFPIVAALSLGQFATPRIQGLDKVLPTLIFNHREF